MTIDIVALDPGTTTGVAIYGDEGYRALEIKPDTYPHAHESLYDLLCSLDPKIVVYEKFLFRQSQTGVVFRGVEYIGVIELYAQLHYKEVYKISPSDGKAFWDNKKIRALDLWVASSPHAMDATRILLTHRMRTEPQFKEDILQILKHKL